MRGLIAYVRVGSGVAPSDSLLDSALVVCRSTLAATLGVVVGVDVDAVTAEVDTDTIGVEGSVIAAGPAVVVGSGVELTVITGVLLAICTKAGECVVGTSVIVVVGVDDCAELLLLIIVCCSTVAVDGCAVVVGVRVCKIVVPEVAPTWCNVCTPPTPIPLLIIDADTDG